MCTFLEYIINTYIGGGDEAGGSAAKAGDVALWCLGGAVVGH